MSYLILIVLPPVLILLVWVILGPLLIVYGNKYFEFIWNKANKEGK